MPGQVKHPVLEVSPRKIQGRQVKKLRREGSLPANIYGHKVKSLAVTAQLDEVNKLYQQVGETGLIDLTVTGEKSSRPVLFHNPQHHPVDSKLVHVDFYQVDLTEKITSSVPVEITGESPAVVRNEGVLVQLLNEIEVEALPTDLPERIIVDISGLEKIDDSVTVEKAIQMSGIDTKKVTPQTDLSQLVVKIEAPAKEEEPAPAAEEAAAEGVPPAEPEAAESPAKEEPAKPEPAKDQA